MRAAQNETREKHRTYKKTKGNDRKLFKGDVRQNQILAGGRGNEEVQALCHRSLPGGNVEAANEGFHNSTTIVTNSNLGG